jgi:hypothetical protein
MKKLIAFTSSVVISVAALAQNADSAFIRRIADEVLTNGQSYEDLRVLTKQIGARLSGSPQMVKAEQWGLQTLKALDPDKAWLQQCMVPHWVRGGKDVAKAAYTSNGSKKVKELSVLALGNSVGSMKPLTAAVVEVKDFDELQSKKDDVKGKIVFYNYSFIPTYIRTFRSYADAVKYRGNGPSEAARYGAVGVIVRSMSHGANNVPHTGSTRYADSIARIPAVAIGLQDADWLSNQLKDGNVSVTMLTRGRSLPDTIGHNVIAEIKGSEFPDEYITVGGHLDSWDVGEGAHDDGAGIVQTIEILRTFKKLGYQPKRTIRFVLFANEENGTRGGQKYADEAKANGEKHIFALESDNGGFTPRGFSMTGTDAQYQKMLAWQPLLAHYGATEIERGGGGADIGPLARTQNTPVAGLQPDSQRYFDLHHATNDVFEAVNKRELELGAINMAALIYLVDQYGM